MTNDNITEKEIEEMLETISEVCPICGVDDYVHVESCPIWKYLMEMEEEEDD